MSKDWNARLDKGKVLETALEAWVKLELLGSEWTLTNTAGVYRDKSGNKFPDFTVTNIKTQETFYLEAKHKHAYSHPIPGKSGKFFTMDSSFVTSYRNVSASTKSQIIMAYYDDRMPGNLFFLDINTPEDLIHSYHNKHNINNRPSYLWNITKFNKIKFTL